MNFIMNVLWIILSVSFPFLKFLIFWLCWVFVAEGVFLWLWRVRATLSLCCSGLPLLYTGLSLWWLLLLQSPGAKRLQPWIVALLSSTAQAQQLWMSSIAPRHVGCSQTRNRTHVSCTGRQILYHWATWEALHFLLSFLYLKSRIWTCELTIIPGGLTEVKPNQISDARPQFGLLFGAKWTEKYIPSWNSGLLSKSGLAITT